MKLAPFCFLALFAAARAATLDVTTTADAGAGSLRAQIAAAVSGDTVNLPLTGVITLTTGEIAISGKNLTLNGPGANQLAITTNASTRALKIVNAACTIRGLAFRNCKGLPGDVDTGGAISVDNFTSGGRSNVTTIEDCEFTGNQSGWGGAVDIFQGGLQMSRCTFAGNSCTGSAFGTDGGGGALSVGLTVASQIVNCTFSANTQSGAATAQPGGGAVFNYGATFSQPATLTFEHCTFAGNVDASGMAGVIRGNYTGSYHTWAKLKNCLLLNNQAPSATLKNFAGPATGALTSTFSSLGGNVTDEATTSPQFMPSNVDKVSVPGLGASVAATLADNGATVRTHAISRGSPAQASGVSSSVATDERGAMRHSNPDAGAFELMEPELGVSVAAAPIAEGGAIPIGTAPFDASASQTVTLTNTQTSPFATGPLSLASLQLPPGCIASDFPTAALGNGESVSFTVTVAGGSPGVLDAPFTFTGNDRPRAALAINGAAGLNLHTLRLTGLITDTIDHWRTTHFGAGAGNIGDAADTASPAHDGIPNLLKYSLGLNPNVAYAPAAIPTPVLDGAGHLSLQVAKNPAAADVLLVVESTSDLAAAGAWSSDAVIVDEDTPSSLRAHDSVTVGTVSGRFLRVRATRP